MLTIGEFSKLSHVSARMLRHYDQIGLLRPSCVGENGYRYYDQRQLSDLVRIEALKGYGFSLAEIGGLLSLSGQELAERIHVRRLKAYEELNSLRKTLRRMEDEIVKMEGTGLMTSNYKVTVLPDPARKVFCLRKKISISETHDLFQELHRKMEAQGYRRTGPTQLMYLGQEFDYDAMDVEAQVQVEGEGEGVRLLPGATCAATVHTGPYETVRYAYEAVSGWLAGHPEYELCGPAIERYLKDEGMASSPDELETGVLFPVKKMQEA